MLDGLLDLIKRR